MDGRTHLAGGIAAGLLVACFSDNQGVALGVALAGAAAMVPDRVQYVVKGKDLPLEGHRGVSHTLMFLILTTIWFRPEFALYWAAGLMSHYILDLPSHSGIPLIYPLKRDRIALGWFTNDSWQAKVLLAGLIGFIIVVPIYWLTIFFSF